MKKIVSDFELFNNNVNVYSKSNNFQSLKILTIQATLAYLGDNVDLSNFITLPFLGKSNFEFTIKEKDFNLQFLDSQLKARLIVSM